MNCSQWNEKIGGSDGDSKSFKNITQPIIRLGPNRDPDNSYDIASLADIHYRFLSLRGRNALFLKWDETSVVDQIVKKIESIRFDEEPGEQD